MRRVVGLMVVVMVMAALPVLAGKVGFVDAERAVMEVEQGKQKLKEFEEWAVPRRLEVKAAAEKLAAIRKQLADQQAVASPETLDRLGREELTARRAFEDAKRKFERDLSTKQDEFLADVATRVGQVTTDYGKANGYDAIFVLNAQPVVYMAEDANLTETIIRLYNERFPVE
jgi:outer membrane protein